MTGVLLISYAGYPYSPNSLMPDNGLANLAGQLISNGHRALILDYGTISTMKRLFPESIRREMRDSLRSKDSNELSRLEKMLENDQRGELENISSEVIERIEQFKPEIVGFKLWWGDGFFGSLHIAERIRKHDDRIKIIAGGPHVDYFNELIFKKTKSIDILAFGDGEETILRIVDYVEGKTKLGDIPNIIYLGGNQPRINRTEWVKDLNGISMPVYGPEVYPSMEGDGKIKIITIDESRGCPFDCYFCIQPVKSGRFLRLVKPERVVEIMNTMKEKYGIGTFRFAGSSTPGRHIQAIGEEIINRNIDVNYTSFARVNYANPDFFGLMRQSGLRALFFGVESGSQRILDESINKQVKVEDMKRVLLESKKAGVYTIASVIVPSPLDTDETIEETYEFLRQTDPDSVIVNPMGIFPHTEWFSNPQRFNIQINSLNYLEELMLYKPLLLFPPDRWKPLPYITNGKTFVENSRESSDFNQRLERQGVVTSISDDIYMMSYLAGYSPLEFRDMCRNFISLGDYESMRDLAAKINKKSGEHEQAS